LLSFFLQYYLPYRRYLFVIVGGSLGRGVLELCFPYIVKRILEEELPLKSLELLGEWTGMLLVLYLLSFGVHYMVNYLGFKLSTCMERDMRCDLFAHMERLSCSFYDRHKTGELLARLTSDLNELGELAGRGPIDLVVCLVTMLGTMLMLLWLNPYLGALVTLLLLLKTLHMVLVNKRMKRTYAHNRVANGELVAKAQEALSGMRLLQAFAMEARELEGFRAKAEAYVRACWQALRIRSYFMSSMLFFSNFINIVILAAGGLLIAWGKMSFGDLVAFFLYVGMFMKPLMQLLGFSEIYQRGMAGFQRFYELMREEPAIKDAADARELRSCEGRIEFRHVSFAYEQGSRVLDDLSLVIEPGEKVAFVGATGAGKTTIASLLLRFYDVDEGAILLDGIDLRELTQQSLRSRIGLVQQDVFLFGESARYNIAYGSPDASQEEIRAAARAAAAEKFIERLPQGYDTMVGERGVRLSGGQKQRIAIARVFLKDPSVLILDEATSALDNLTEREIQGELDRLAVGRTTLIIAHRLSTVRKADKIVVLDEGRVLEAGTHEELLAHKQAYYRLYNQQEKNS
jgi:ATP-binding cassette subfamily B protein